MEASQPAPAFSREDRPIVAGATLLLLIGMPIGWLSGDTSTGDAIAFVIAIAINLSLMAAMFLRFVPRQRAAGRAARTGLITAIVAAVLLLVFWTGLPFPIGAGAVALGLFARIVAVARRRAGQGHGRDRRGRTGRAARLRRPAGRVVGREGLEPSTLRLRVSCSTS